MLQVFLNVRFRITGWARDGSVAGGALPHHHANPSAPVVDCDRDLASVHAKAVRCFE